MVTGGGSGAFDVQCIWHVTFDQKGAPQVSQVTSPGFSTCAISFASVAFIDVWRDREHLGVLDERPASPAGQVGGDDHEDILAVGELFAQLFAAQELIPLGADGLELVQRPRTRVTTSSAVGMLSLASYMSPRPPGGSGVKAPAVFAHRSGPPCVCGPYWLDYRSGTGVSSGGVCQRVCQR